MSKLFVPFLAFSTLSLSAGHQQASTSLGVFLDNSKIKLLSNPVAKGVYNGDDTNYDDLSKALAALQHPITVEKVREVLKEHAWALSYLVEDAETAFALVRDNIDNADAKDFVVQVGQLLEKYYVVGMLLNEQASERERLHKLCDVLNDEVKDYVRVHLRKAVEQALYNTCPMCRAGRA